MKKKKKTKKCVSQALEVFRSDGCDKVKRKFVFKVEKLSVKVKIRV